MGGRGDRETWAVVEGIFRVCPSTSGVSMVIWLVVAIRSGLRWKSWLIFQIVSPARTWYLRLGGAKLEVGVTSRAVGSRLVVSGDEESEGLARVVVAVLVSLLMAALAR